MLASMIDEDVPNDGPVDEKPDGAPKWKIRVALTLLFPK